MTLARAVHRSIALTADSALVAQWSPASAAVFPRVARALGIATTFQSDRGVLLTFDDGPHPRAHRQCWRRSISSAHPRFLHLR
jgi:hypothetical protein